MELFQAGAGGVFVREAHGLQWHRDFDFDDDEHMVLSKRLSRRIKARIQAGHPVYIDLTGGDSMEGGVSTEIVAMSPRVRGDHLC